MKERVLKELGYVFGSEEVVGFFSFTLSKVDDGRVVPTVMWICDNIEKSGSNGKTISEALFALAEDTIKKRAEGDVRLAYHTH